MGSGCGSVDSAVTSETRGPQFESSHWQTLYYLFTVIIIEKTKIKEAGSNPNSVQLLSFYGGYQITLICALTTYFSIDLRFLFLFNDVIVAHSLQISTIECNLIPAMVITH